MADTNANIVEHFGEVLKLSEEHTVDIIRHLAQTYRGSSAEFYFTRCLSDLKPLTKSHAGNIRIAHSKNNIVENTIVKAGIGKGSSGEVSLSAKGLIYKTIRLKKGNPYHLEEDIREIFLEVFIQTVLNTNPQFDGRIPRVFHIYRSKYTFERELVLYIVMENVPISLTGYMEKQLKTSGDSKLDIVDVAPMFIQLGLLLKDLHDAFGFYHRDLHAGNIMFNETGALNIIDFGKACLVVNGVTYALPGGPCRSWDLLILLTYLLQYNYHLFHTSVLNMFRELLTSTNNIDFYTYALQVGNREYIPAFHTVYPDYIQEWWRDEERDALLHNSPYLEPANFVQFMVDQVDSKLEQRSPLVRQSPQRNLYISPEKIGGLYRMANKNSRKSNRKNRSTRRNMRKNHSGGDYQTSQQWFDPDVLPPATILPAVSTAPTSSEIRPVLLSTFQSAGGRKTRRRGGFSPSVMGGFVANAQSAIVPLALYAVYHTMVPKKGPATLGGLFKNMTRKNRRNSRK